MVNSLFSLASRMTIDRVSIRASLVVQYRRVLASTVIATILSPVYDNVGELIMKVYVNVTILTPWTGVIYCVKFFFENNVLP